MTARSHARLTGWTAAAAVLVGLHAPSQAQSVFKCTADGKTVYQSSPCAGQGKKLDLAPGPSEQEIQAAKTRATSEKANADSIPTTAAPALDNRSRGAPVDCARLNQERADAFGRRNGAVRASRGSNDDQSSVVDRSQGDIRRIEGKMVQGGCKPT